ncbi:LOW QUALITY PROTEIN: hypothetical protein Cgig2_015013 [Carnegiea gigantea]|uniref:Uncharacterized protein n=1 Tax=Carnegiea gigantea TaxID=171969 RepID=A0A9Q1JJB6_9CARY|nr:LOW QUALITY PROTEIN: hypothetical protein Cgig2_015013 [Carnegiea gigantea]
MTLVNRVKYMYKPIPTDKAETTSTEVHDSNALDAKDIQAEQAPMEESGKTENILTQQPDFPEENPKEEDNQAYVRITCPMPNITLVKEKPSSGEAILQGNVEKDLDISSSAKAEQPDDREKFSLEVEELAAKEAKETISVTQLEHKSKDVALVEDHANQRAEMLHVDTVCQLEESHANSCTATTDENKQMVSLEKVPEIHDEGRSNSEEIDPEKHHKTISSGLLADEKSVLTSEADQTTMSDATEETADQKGFYGEGQHPADDETIARSQKADNKQTPIEKTKILDEKDKVLFIVAAQDAASNRICLLSFSSQNRKASFLILKIVLFYRTYVPYNKHNKQVQVSKQTAESDDKAEEYTTEDEDTLLLSGQKEAAFRGKVSSLDIPNTQASSVVPRTPEATEERKAKILTNDSDSPTDPKHPENVITVTDGLFLEKCAINTHEKPCQLSEENQQPTREVIQEDRV